VKRVAFLLALATTLALAVVAAAAPPPVDAEAYLVQNSGTGEVLASQDERERLPMASITKLMTASSRSSTHRSTTSPRSRRGPLRSASRRSTSGRVSA
jgi:hypothetical protein